MSRKAKPQLALVVPQIEQRDTSVLTAPITKEDVEEMRAREEPGLFPLALNYASSGMAYLERGALLRVFRDRFRSYVRYLMSDRGGKHSVEQAIAEASVRYDQRGAEALMDELLSTPIESVEFTTLKDLWDCSPEDAERFFALMKNEAQREFATGHAAAKAFAPVEWMETVWRRAQFIGMRDSFCEEYEPRGGIEHALIDTLTQAYFMQQYWMERAVERTNTDPRRESFEYAQFAEYKRQTAKARQWEPGYWEIPYVSESRAIEAATQMADMFARLFQRTLRQLNSHRLIKYKIAKLKADTRRVNALTRRARKSD